MSSRTPKEVLSDATLVSWSRNTPCFSKALGSKRVFSVSSRPFGTSKVNDSEVTSFGVRDRVNPPRARATRVATTMPAINLPIRPPRIPCDRTRTHTRHSLPLKGADQFSLSEDVSLHGGEELVFTQPCSDAQGLVESVELEMIVVPPVALGRHRTSVPGPFEAVLPFDAAALLAFLETGQRWGKLIEDPVDPRLGSGSVGIVADEGQLFRGLGDTRPGEGRRYVRPFPTILFRNGPIGFEGGARYPDR